VEIDITSARYYPRQHIRLYARPLRRAYRDAGSLPAAGTWRTSFADPSGDERDIVYQCPLNLTCSAFSVEAAAFAWATSTDCTKAFTRGWDGEPPFPGECRECFSRGARLRKALKPRQF
jgi:hypothetical protein